jgi:hypothetical protein
MQENFLEKVTPYEERSLPASRRVVETSHDANICCVFKEIVRWCCSSIVPGSTEGGTDVHGDPVPFEEEFEDPGGGSPDDVPLVRDKVDLRGLHIGREGAPVPVARIGQEVVGNEEDLGNLVAAHAERVGIGDVAHEGVNGETGADGDDRAQGAENLHVFRADAYFLVCLPEGGGEKGLVAGVANAAGKGDLALVGLHRLRPLGEEDVEVVLLVKKRHENSRKGQLRRGRRRPGGMLEVPADSIQHGEGLLKERF